MEKALNEATVFAIILLTEFLLSGNERVPQLSMANIHAGPLCSRFTALGVVHRARGGSRVAFGPRFRWPETACDPP